MAPSRSTWFDDRGLIVGAPDGRAARRLDLRAGTLHYWRLPAARWKACLSAMRTMGLTAVDSCVPWRVHEPTAGSFDWRGDRDLRRFVDTAGEAGLAVLLRVGPGANAELTGFGFPDDVLQAPELSARTAHGALAYLPAPPRSFAIPSYASAALHARVRSWYAAIAGQVAALAAPAGPLVALGVDHEAQRFFRRAAYDLDYHPEAVARWAARHPQWPEPPRQWADADAARCLAWVRFQEHEAAAALARFAAALDDVGLGALARFHDVRVGTAARFAATAIAGAAGLASHGPFAPAALRRAALRSFTSPLPMVCEAGVGDAPWAPPAGGAEADRRRALTLLSAGARALTFTMAVERDRWVGGLLEPAGAPAAEAGWAASLLRTLDEVEWTSLRRRPAFALLTAEASAHHALATSLLDPMAPVAAEQLQLADLGAPSSASRWQRAVELALERAGLAYDVVAEPATADELAGYRVVLCPGERLPRDLWQTLHDVAEQRRAIVVLGPTPPSLDEDGAPLPPPPRRIGKMRPGSLTDLDGLATDLAALAPDPPAWRSPFVLSVFFAVAAAEAEQGAAAAAAPAVARVLFVHNDGPARTAAVATSDGARALRDALTGERIELAPDPSGAAAPLALAADDVRMFVVER